MERHGLYRSRTDRVIAGVAGGIARSLNADPAIVRVIFALLIIFGGGGLLLYLILWIAIPEEPFEIYQAPISGDPAGASAEQTGDEIKPEPPVFQPKKNNGAMVVGVVLIAIGGIFLVDRLIPEIHFHFRDYWPVFIVIAGLALIYSSFSKGPKH